MKISLPVVLGAIAGLGVGILWERRNTKSWERAWWRDYEKSRWEQRPRPGP